MRAAIFARRSAYIALVTSSVFSGIKKPSMAGDCAFDGKARGGRAETLVFKRSLHLDYLYRSSKLIAPLLALIILTAFLRFGILSPRRHPAAHRIVTQKSRAASASPTDSINSFNFIMFQFMYNYCTIQYILLYSYTACVKSQLKIFFD
jgi:hypothetical protein